MACIGINNSFLNHFNSSICQSRSYCSPIDFVAYCYTFSADSTFIYKQAHCTGFEYGKGTYRINKDSLMLTFDKLPDLKPSQVKILSFDPRKDSLILNLTTLDSINREPIIFATIAAYSDGKLVTGIDSDYNGKGIIHLNPKLLPIMLEVKYLGYKWKKFIINKVGEYQILVEAIKGNNPRKIHHQVREFQIYHWDQDSLVLGEFNNIPMRTLKVREK